MIVRAFKAPPKDLEKMIMLRLIETASGVDLVVCNTDGDEWIGGKILTITDEGTLRRYDSLQRHFGLQLNRLGTIAEGSVICE